MKPLKENKNLLSLLGLFIFIANTLMFDYLPWEIWWVPVLHIVYAAIIIWILLLVFKSSKTEVKKNVSLVPKRSRLFAIFGTSFIVMNYFLITNGGFHWWNILLTNFIMAVVVVWSVSFNRRVK